MIVGETITITDEDSPADIVEKMLDPDTCVVLDLRTSMNNSLENIVVLEKERQKYESEQKKKDAEYQEEKKTHRFF